MTPTRRTSKPHEPERRQQTGLREVIQDLLDHIRELAGKAPTLTEMELEYGQQRLEWLADEVWRTLLETESADEAE